MYTTCFRINKLCKLYIFDNNLYKLVLMTLEPRTNNINSNINTIHIFYRFLTTDPDVINESKLF